MFANYMVSLKDVSTTYKMTDDYSFTRIATTITVVSADAGDVRFRSTRAIMAHLTKWDGFCPVIMSIEDTRNKFTNETTRVVIVSRSATKR